MKMLKYKQWPVQYRLLAVFFVFVVFLVLFASRGHAEEPKTVSELAKEAVIDGLAGTVSIAAAAEQAITGNFYTGAALAILGAHEVIKAYEEAREAWNLYCSRDNDYDRNISPAESCMEHGRD